MKSKTEFLVINFLTGFSVCFYISTAPVLLNLVLNDTAQMVKKRHRAHCNGRTSPLAVTLQELQGVGITFFRCCLQVFQY